MTPEARLALIQRNTAEIVTLEDLQILLREKKTPIVYCGYEPNGPMHLGHFVTITKLMDFAKAGFKIKILLADVHAFLNRKGSEADIVREVENWRKTISAIGLDAEVILGSSFQFNKDYLLEVFRLSQISTITRGIRSMQEIARDIENATVSQLLYPLMQVVDIKYLDVDVAEGGLEQRKVHMLGKDLMGLLKHSFVAVHTPLITSLKGPGQKMSKSISGSGIAVTDSFEEIKRCLKNAYCPEKVSEENPVLQIAKLILFPRFGSLTISRPLKFGGALEIMEYEELEHLFVAGKIHPLDLKNAVADSLENIIKPIRDKWKKG